MALVVAADLLIGKTYLEYMGIAILPSETIDYDDTNEGILGITLETVDNTELEE